MLRLIDAPGAGQASALDTVGHHETLDPDDPLASGQRSSSSFIMDEEIQEAQEVQGDEQSQCETAN
jgi:hypothetical protein